MRRGGGWCSEAALKACFQVGPQYTHEQGTPCKQTAIGFPTLLAYICGIFEILFTQCQSPFSSSEVHTPFYAIYRTLHYDA